MNPASECRLFVRYLMAAEAEGELVERYVAAQHALLGEHVRGTSKELDFLHRHPAALPFLDAGTSLLAKRSALRQRLYLAAALIEASPRFADFFLYPAATPLGALCGLFWCGLTSALKLAIGVPLVWWVRKGWS